MSYKKLHIYQLADDNVLKIHKMSLKLPSFEIYESGSQIRRSSKSVKFNIVEGYGRRFYKSEFIRFMIIAQASNDETLDILETLYNTGSLDEENVYKDLRKNVIRLGEEINSFIIALKKRHNNWQ